MPQMATSPPTRSMKATRGDEFIQSFGSPVGPPKFRQNVTESQLTYRVMFVFRSHGLWDCWLLQQNLSNTPPNGPLASQSKDRQRQNPTAETRMEERPEGKRRAREMLSW